MGTYFSLHDAAFWEQTISEAPEPSIWSNVRHSPLALHQRLLLHRPGTGIYFSHTSGLRQGGTGLVISESSEVSLLVGFEETVGRLYSAVVLRAPESAPHRYGRELEEVTLKHPANRAPVSPTSPGMGGACSPDATRLPKNIPLEMEKLHQEKALQECGWPCLLIYAVKEGVLLFFCQDVAECEEVVCEVAQAFATETPADSQPSKGPLSGTASGANLAASLKVKCVEHCVGRAPPGSTRLITDLIIGDLKREFAVRCDPEEQPNCTNCAVFCLRSMMAMQLAVRGYDIKAVCESPKYRASLGPKVGEAACHAWEQLWRTARA